MEREQLEVDVLFVGAGPASLAGALHLSRLIRTHNQEVSSGARAGRPLNDLTILVIEKGKEIGSHILSGAVVKPGAFDELLEGLASSPPYESEVVDDAFVYLGKKKGYRSPINPPNLRNHGYQVASLGKLVRWMVAPSARGSESCVNDKLARRSLKRRGESESPGVVGRARRARIRSYSARWKR